MRYKVEFEPKNIGKRFCSQPWNFVTIENEGNVYSCMCSNWTGVVLGNILTQSLEDIYANSVSLKSLRQSVTDGNYGWCKDYDCNEIKNLPAYETNPFTELNINPIPRLPTNLTLAIDFNCNLKCLTCRLQRHFETTVNPTVDAILKNLALVYKNFDQTVNVMCDGSGDLFVSQAYNNFLFNGDLPECWNITLMTNGNLLTKKKEQIKSIRNQIDMITITIDAATSETYKITRGGDFDTVLKGIEMLKELNISVYLQFVLQQDNYKELLKYKKLANDFNVHYGIQKVDRRGHMSPEIWAQLTVEDSPNVDNTMLKEYLLELSNDRMCNLDGGTRWLLAKL